MSSSDDERLYEVSGGEKKTVAPKVQSLADIMLARQLATNSAEPINAEDTDSIGALDADEPFGSSESVPVEGLDMMSYFSNPTLHAVVPGLVDDEDQDKGEAPLDSLAAITEERELTGNSEEVVNDDEPDNDSPGATPLRTVHHSVDAHHMPHTHTGEFHKPYVSTHPQDDVPGATPLRTVHHSVDAHHMPHTHTGEFHQPKQEDSKDHQLVPAVDADAVVDVGREPAGAADGSVEVPFEVLTEPVVESSGADIEAEMEGPVSSVYTDDSNEIELSSTMTLISGNCQLDSLFKDAKADATEPLVMKILTLQIQCDSLMRERDGAISDRATAVDELQRMRELQSDAGSSTRELQERVVRAEQAKDMLFSKANQVDKFRNELRDCKEQLDASAAENAELRAAAAGSDTGSGGSSGHTGNTNAPINKATSNSKPIVRDSGTDDVNDSLVRQLRSKNDVLLAEMRELQAGIDTAAAASAERGSENSGAVGQLNSQLLSTTRENASLMDQNRQLQEELYQAETSKTMDTIKMADQSRELDALMDQNRQLQGELYKVETGVTMDSVKFADLVREMDALRAQSSEEARQYEYKLRDAELKLDGMHEEVTRALQYKLQFDAETMKVRKLGSDYSALESQLGSAKSAMQKLEYDCGALRNENSHLKQRIDILLNSSNVNSGYGNPGAVPLATPAAPSVSTESTRGFRAGVDRAPRNDYSSGGSDAPEMEPPLRSGRGTSLGSYSAANADPRGEPDAYGAPRDARRQAPTPPRQQVDPPAPPQGASRGVTRVPVNDQGAYMAISDRPMFKNNVERDDFLENMDKNYNEKHRGSLGGGGGGGGGSQSSVRRNPNHSPAPVNDYPMAGGMNANSVSSNNNNAGGGGGARSLSDLLGSKASVLNTNARGESGLSSGRAAANPAPSASYERPTSYGPTKSTHAATNPFATDTYSHSDEMANFDQLEKKLTSCMFEKTSLSGEVDKYVICCSNKFYQ